MCTELQVNYSDGTKINDTKIAAIIDHLFCAANLYFSKNMTDDEFKQWLCCKGLTKEQDHRVLLGKIRIAVPVATSLAINIIL